MAIGYACQLIGVKNTQLKSCTFKNATPSRLTELIKANLEALDHMIDYNIKNDIKLFRISSDVIPFGSAAVNTVNWWDVFAEELTAIGKKITSSCMRVSVHPGQYTVLNSNNEEVVIRAVEDLNYHTCFLDCLGLSPAHKVILHIGGAYGDKDLAMKRFEARYLGLSEQIKKRLVIENDDKIYDIEEVLRLGIKLKIPVIFDNLHHQINPPVTNLPEKEWIERCKSTWGASDGPQKIHYSQQEAAKKAGAHSQTIHIKDFMAYFQMIDSGDIDIMLEVKDKNLSCVKCILSTSPQLKISRLEEEWGKYKYSVLERSQTKYLEIRAFLKNKKDFSAADFYVLIETGLESSGNLGSYVNGVEHVWGYFKAYASEREKASFLKALENFKNQQIELKAVKGLLKKMAEKYEEGYLLSGYYFDI